MKKNFLVGLGLFLCCSLVAPNAFGLSVIQLSEEKMVDLSTFIVRGKVLSQRCQPGPNNIGIVTLVTIQVSEELVKRKSPRTVVIRHFGGKIGNREVRINGGPSFTNGNEVVVFVQKSQYLPANEYLLVGLTQGKWVVHRPAANASYPKASREPVVVRSLGHLKMVKSPHLSVGTQTANRLTLKSMRSRLQGHYKKIVARRKAKQLKLPKARVPQIRVAPRVRPLVIRPQLKTPKARPTPRTATPTTPKRK